VPGQVTHSLLQSVFFTLSAAWSEAYQSTQPWSSQIAMQVPSTTRENRYGWMAKLPKLREWIGERNVHRLASRAYSITNKDFELTVGLDRNDLEDDTFGLFTPTVQMMGQQAAKWPDDLVKEVLQAAISTLCYDGQYFFDTDHPVSLENAALGTYSNRKTSFALTSANYATARADMLQFKDNDNRPMGIVPNILLVPPQLEVTAMRIINSELVPSAAGTATENNPLKGTAKIVMVPELANEAGVWYLLATQSPIKPFLFQLRKAPQFAQLTAPTDRNVFFHKEYIYGTDSRGNAGFTLPHLAMRCEA